MSADLHAEIKQTVHSIINERLTGIDIMNEINNSTRVYDKLDEISTKMSQLINEIAQINLQTVTVNSLSSVNNIQPSIQDTIQIKEEVKPKRGRKPSTDKVFIPVMENSNVEMTSSKNKKSTEFAGEDFLNNLKALDNLK